MQHSTYIAYWKDLANKHKSIADNRPISVDPGARMRKSFFLINDEEQYIQSLGNTVDFPCLCLLPVYGQINGPLVAAVDTKTIQFEVREKVNTSDDFSAIETARHDCKKIAMNLLARLLSDMETKPCSWMSEVEEHSGYSYDYTGPVGENEYGCLIKITMSGRAKDMGDTSLLNNFY